MAERLVAGLPHGSRVALGLFAADRDRRLARPRALALALACLGVELEPGDPPARSSSGLVAARVGDAVRAGRRLRPGDRRRSSPSTTLLAHPVGLNAARTVLPEGDAPPEAGPGPPGPRGRRPGADPPAGRRLAADRRGAAPPDPAGDVLQARPRAARGRPGPRRPDRRRPRAAARHGPALDRRWPGRVGLVVARAGQRPAGRRPARLLGRERRPPAADDRHPLARASATGTSRPG